MPIRNAHSVARELQVLKELAERKEDASAVISQNAENVLNHYMKEVQEVKEETPSYFDYEKKENKKEEKEKQRKNSEYAAILIERIIVLDEAKNNINDINNLNDLDGSVKDFVNQLAQETHEELEAFETKMDNAKADEYSGKGMTYSDTLMDGIKCKVRDCTKDTTKCPEGVDQQQFFAEQKAIVRELAARAIVIQSLDHQVRNMAVQGELSNEEVSEAYKEYFAPKNQDSLSPMVGAYVAMDNINIVDRADEIKNSANFKLMMKDLDSPEKLEKFKAEMGQKSQLLKRLAVYNNAAMDAKFDDEAPKEPTVQIPVNKSAIRFNDQFMRERKEQQELDAITAAKTNKEIKQEIKAMKEAPKAAPAGPKMGH